MSTPPPLRVVFDTDTANEIDDQFALAWALRAPERIRLEAVHAAPFSHGTFFGALADAAARRGGPATPFEEMAVRMGPDGVARLLERIPVAESEQRSYDEILRVFEAAGVDPGDRVKRGATSFMSGPDEPVESEAVDHLIALAKTASPEAPIHVATIGVPTNVASALLVDPAIAPNLHVIFLAGYPTGAGLPDDSFNLVQDRHASNVLFESEVPLLYVPGYQVAEVLQLALPAAREWLEGRSRLAQYLFDTYTNNPIEPEPGTPGKSWVIWDIIATAWLIEPEWVPTRTVPRARVRADHTWEPVPDSRATMQEAYGARRNAIFGDLLARVTRD